MNPPNNTSLVKVSVFDAAALGYVTTRIPALVCTGKGTLLAFCEARRDWHDWAVIDTLLRRSEDGGATWDDARAIFRSEGTPAGNPTPIVDRSGVVHFLCQRNYERGYYLRSEDDGLTWSDPRDITGAYEAFRPEYDWQVIAPGPGHGIQLSDRSAAPGRLLVPIWLCDPATPKVPPGDHRPSCVATIYSDDGGASWRRGEIVLNTTAEHVNPSETVAVELSDGRVMLNIRSESPRHRRLVSVGSDGIGGWSPPRFDEALYEPVCEASLVRHAPGGALIFCNPDSRQQAREILPDVRFCARQNGEVKLSFDDGKTWPVSRVLDPGMFSYSDLAVAPDGAVFCLYEAGTTDGGGIGQTTHVVLARFGLDWVKG